MDNQYVIDLGGSIAFTEKGPVLSLLKKFVSEILLQVKKGRKFVIVAGGGFTARSYQQAARKIGKPSNDSLDWVGIRATQLNAELLRSMFDGVVLPEVIRERFQVKDLGNYSLAVAGGFLPGASTDFVACQLAVDFGIKKVIALSKPKYVYTANPEKSKKAKPIKKMTWNDYFKLMPKKWSPGIKIPIDQKAAYLAKEKSLVFIVSCGRKIANFRKILENLPFQGTTIEN